MNKNIFFLGLFFIVIIVFCCQIYDAQKSLKNGTKKVLKSIVEITNDIKSDYESGDSSTIAFINFIDSTLNPSNLELDSSQLTPFEFKTDELVPSVDTDSSQGAR